MDEPLAWPGAILASITKVLFVAGLFIAFSTLNSTAQQCGRGQVLIVGRHTCVSQETFQQFQRAWRTGKAAPSVTSRRVDPAPAKTADTKPAAKPGAASPKPPVAAEAAPVPPPKPVVANATPAPAPAARDMSTTPAEITTATPTLTAAPVAAMPSAPAPASPPPAAAKKPSSPYGELQLR